MSSKPAIEGDRPSMHGKMLGKALSLFAEIGRRAAPMPIPEPCLTRAFREGSMPNQTAGTGKVALACVLRIDTDRFACHHGMKDGEPTKLCAGWIAAMLAPFSEVKEILAAFADEMSALGDAPDEVRLAFDVWLNHTDPGRRLDVYQAAREYAKSQMAATWQLRRPIEGGWSEWQNVVEHWDGSRNPAWQYRPIIMETSAPVVELIEEILGQRPSDSVGLQRGSL